MLGRPNVGKSTLINTLLGQKVAAVSPRPQTTRHRQLCILTLENAQIVFVDTPGIHQPRYKLGEWMNQTAQQALEDCDAILFLVDSSQEPSADDRLLGEFLQRLRRTPPLILALNKSDLITKEEQTTRQTAFANLLPVKFIASDKTSVLCISATRGDNLKDLLDALVALLPESEPHFPEDQITDRYERQITADLVREAALIFLRDEVPHGIYVQVDEFQERENGNAYIAATLYVEREAHKPIVIGEGGSMLKKIGSAARKEIENMSGRKIFLQLRVKVRKSWRDDDKALRQFGFSKK